MFCFFLTGVQLLEYGRHTVYGYGLFRINALLEAGRLLEGALIEKNHKKGGVYLRGAFNRRGRLFEALR